LPTALLFYFHHVSRFSRSRPLDQKAGPTACIKALIVAVATRHADAVDIKFLADGKPVWVALPLVAWVEYQRRAARSSPIRWRLAIAGRYLKTALEAGEGMGREMYSLTVPQTLQHLEAIATETPSAGRSGGLDSPQAAAPRKCSRYSLRNRGVAETAKIQ